ncbi:hypothetical protein, partial [Streptomyces sp. E5N91]|uniref:hypothetical protein n=1 Tax=Streptomyces sp. E5N91 TaxID=1851996 RepID=UPI001EE9383E
MTTAQRRLYGALIQVVIDQATEFTEQGMTAEKAWPPVIVRGATSPVPRTRYIIGLRFPRCS